MHKRWVVKPKSDATKVSSLAKQLNVTEIIAELLVQRGIYTFQEAKSFFRPSLDELHNPFLMKDMDIAVNRIFEAVNKNQKILVYGDYDVDGTTAVALVYTFLKEWGVENDNIDFYIPDRYHEGYGISYQGIDFAKNENFSLVIALDCGIKAVEKITYANEAGVDFIICDHHRPGDAIPEAIAVLDPKRSDCDYPFKELSGCGVGFKLIQAIAQKSNLSTDTVYKFLDLVAVSIASDIVPITGENRILAAFGLKMLNSKPRACFESILKYANITKKPFDGNPSNGNIYAPLYEECYFCRELTISDLVFLIGPRINAAGRIESGKNAVRLLISDNANDAEILANQINEFNTTRRDLDLSTTDEALEDIKKITRLQNSKSTVVFNKEWHKGVIGIVASRLIETYYRPTIVLTQSNGLITGSARSIKDFDIYDALDECSNLLEHFGGHKYAAGLSMRPENLDTFIERFEKVVSSRVTKEMMTPEVEIDLKITLKDIDNKFLRILKQFAPFGPGNPVPVFQTDGVVDNGNARLLKNKHLKLTIGHMEYASNPIPAIAFQLGNHFENISLGQPFNICYHIEENEWNNKREIQINIKDIYYDSDKPLKDISGKVYQEA
jgi:single-stranded-DNA-specific exonuclease